MAVDNANMNPNLYDDSEDDEPLIFKRTNKAPSNDVKKVPPPPPPQRNDAPPRKPTPPPTNGQKAKPGLPATKPLSVGDRDKCRPTGATSLADKEKSKQSPGRSLENNNNNVERRNLDKSPVVHHSRQSSGTSLENNNSERRNFEKSPVVQHSDSEDSDDDKPLSARLSVGSTAPPKSKPTNTPNSSVSEKVKVNVKKPSEDSEDDAPLSSKFNFKPTGAASAYSSGPSSSVSERVKVNVKRPSEDSEDDMPLSSKFNVKPTGSAGPVKKSYSSDEEKPLVSRIQQNGSVKRENDFKSPKLPTKRPLSDANNSGQSSVKKPKPSDASASSKVKQFSVKAERKTEDDDDDDIPISQRIKKSTASGSKSEPVKKTTTKIVSSSIKKVDKKSKKIIKKAKYSQSTKVPPSSGEGQKWTTLEHCGVIFPPPYTPHGVKMLYNGQPVDLTPEQEEVATMFAVMKDTDYAAKPTFIENFMNDWRLILGKNHIIKKFELCDFTPIYDWHQAEKEKKKQMSTEEKKLMKEEKMKQEEKYMWAVVDGVKEKVGNFRVEPPGLFRGRGEHPKMGKLKKRIRPRDITINIGRDALIPECPIPGERWKEVKHDNTVTWLAFWNDPINPKEFKYVFLAASSSLKGQSDKEKYEKARLLKDYIHNIRVNYTRDFKNKDDMKRQIAVATYLIDKLALRAGNEKDDDEADTVGCCTLKVENVTLVPQSNKLQFDFLGKDSIRYFNTVEVEQLVYEAIGQFRAKKKGGDDLFDKLDTSKLNAHLKELMPGLTAKVFRTYNASITLDEMLNKDTKGGDVGEKIVVYQHANKEVAIICNHQRAVSKSHTAQMERLTEKMDELKTVVDGLKTDLMRAKKGKPPLKDADGKTKKNLAPEALERKIAQTNAKIEKMERDMRTKEDLKTVALGTSKINYLDPRISVAWCKRQDVPIEKIFNKSLLAKFAWAMDVDPDFRF